MATVKGRGDGWYVQVRRKGYPAQYRTFRTKSDGMAWAREQEARIDRQEVQHDSRSLKGLTLGDLLRRYVDDVVPTLRGREAAAARLGKMQRAPVCDLSLADLTPGALAAYRDHRLGEVAPSTVKLELALFSRILALARREWGVPLLENPVERVSLPKFHNARDRRLADGDLARLEAAFAETRNPIVRPLVLFAIETAMRRGELLRLEWRHIDHRRRTAYLPHTKNGQPRTIPLTDAALAILGGLSRTDDKVFPITPVALRHAWDRLTTRARLPDLHLHDLRHEGISRFAEMGLTTPELALISGHRDVRMLARYTHLRPSDLAMKLAGRFWANEGAGR